MAKSHDPQLDPVIFFVPSTVCQVNCQGPAVGTMKSEIIWCYLLTTYENNLLNREYGGDEKARRAEERQRLGGSRLELRERDGKASRKEIADLRPRNRWAGKS